MIINRKIIIISAAVIAGLAGGYDAIIPAKSHIVPDAWVGILEAKGLEFEL